MRSSACFSPVLPLVLRSCSTTRISHCRVRTSRWFFNRLLRPALCYAFSHPLSVLLALRTQTSLEVLQSRNSTLCFNPAKRWRRSLWPGKLTLVLLLWNMVVPHCLLPETEKPLLSTCYLGFQLCNKILFLFPFMASSQCFSTFLVLWLLNTVPHVAVMSPNKIISILLYNCNFAIVLHCNINIWYTYNLICDTWGSRPTGWEPLLRQFSMYLSLIKINIQI